MLHLQLFGGLSAYLDDQPLSGRATQRKRLALLALLSASPKKAMSRGKLVGLLWPESDNEHARHQLTTAAYDLRKAIGDDFLVSTPEELRLNQDLIRADLWDFEAALRRSERDRAATLYTGPFLDGVFVSDTPEFERWVDAERDRLAREFAQALEGLAEERDKAGDFRGASHGWRSLADHDPYSSRVALRLMRSLVAAGEPGAALQHARTHTALLRRDLEVEADAELIALAAQLRSQQPGEQNLGDVTAPTDTANKAPAAHPHDALEPSKIVTSEVSDHFPAASEDGAPSASSPGVPRRRSLKWLAPMLVSIATILLGAGVWLLPRLSAAGQPDPHARELYLRGRTAWSERSREGLERSVVLFRRAVERDPAYAEAWAGLADAYVILGFLGFGPPEAMFPKGKAAALRAIELDRSLAAAYAPLGQALSWERDWPGAERALRRAIELDPRHATAHQWYGILMVPLGRIDEAVEHTRQASALDPLSLQINNTHGMLLHYAGRSEEALRHYQQVIQTEPDSQWVRQNPWLLSNASRVFTAHGRYAEAVRLLELALSVVPSHPRPLADLASTYASMGEPAKALQTFSRADTANPQYAYFRASVFAVLGQRDSAFHWLNRVEEWSPSPMGELRMDPRMALLRFDPRYKALLKELGLSSAATPQPRGGNGLTHSSLPGSRSTAGARESGAGAYGHYLKGRYLWNEHRLSSYRDALFHFEQAITIAPDFAPAYSGLADVYVHLDDWDGYSEGGAREKGLAAARRAIHLDDRLSEAHSSLAHLLMHEEEWSAAERAYRRAIELSPNDASTRILYAFYLSAWERHDEAIRQAAHAVELDPLSARANSFAGFTFYFDRRYDEAIAQWQRLLQINPKNARVHMLIAQAHLHAGRREEGLRWARRSMHLANGTPAWMPMRIEFASALALAGQKKEAVQVLEKALGEAERAAFDPLSVAQTYARLGEADRAFQWLEQARRGDHGWLMFLKVEPAYDALRTDPRFAGLLKTMRLET